MESDSIWQLAFLVILLGLSAFFTAVESAFSSLNKTHLQRHVEEGVNGAEKVWKLLESPDKLKKVILTAGNIANIGAVVLASQLAAKYISNMATWVTIIVMSIIILIFGEILPDLLAKTYPEQFSLYTAGFMTALSRILNPIINLLTFISNSMMRLFGWKAREKPQITEEDLLNLVDVGHKEGVIDPEEKKLIQNVFQFGDSQVKDIMIPRTDVIAIDVESTFDEIWDLFQTEQYSRIPVYENTLDNIIGILHIKDVFSFQQNKEGFDIQRWIRKPYYTYENKRIADLFEEMRKKRLQMIVVADEYGGTAGIVTMQDLVEEIFGDIGDEYDDVVDEIQKIAPGEYVIDGLTRLSAINDELGSDLESEHYETIGGFITGIIGRFPKKGEVVVYNELRWMVMDVYRTRVKRLRLQVMEPKQEFVNEEEKANTDKEN